MSASNDIGPENVIADLRWANSYLIDMCDQYKAEVKREEGIWKRAMANLGWGDHLWLPLTKEVIKVRKETS